MRIPIVKIEDDNPRGWKVINEADFDPAQHSVYGEKPKRATTRKSEK